MSTTTDTTMQTRKHYNVDPSALGLFGLALTTLVASSQKLGITTGTSILIPWAFFFGGAAQLFACLEDNKRGNLLGTTAFGAFAMFWFGMGTSWLIQHGVFGESMKAAADPKQLGFIFVGFLIFSFYMTIGAMRTTKVLFSIFVFITLLFVGLSASLLAGEHLAHLGHVLAAWSELAIAILSFYASGALVINHQFGRTVLPLGKML